ncbi:MULTISPECIES: HIT family protein [unclassified Schaalia]|uniref:HIT family protein n=1 Tax=unclassified Schaalia TaxID=2691889 RepID=UPI001E5AED3E|nr:MULTISPECIES: HIT family protein [unclassified Schaalia]MCD4549414.1 HIT family protein [Schaalia sp. lx-260]MCD4557975.1 HIT family protein [Schaalia sp. lx-100]
MSTVFEKIISGDWPGRFVWTDEVCVALMTIEPVSPGHVLVIPRHPWEKWSDCPQEILTHLTHVAQKIGSAQERAFEVSRSAVVIAGFEVPHTHIHVIPARSEADCLLNNAQSAPAEEIEAAAIHLRDQLIHDGYEAYVPPRLESAAS